MNALLRHPIWTGLAFEGVLATLFMLFSVGPCNAPIVGVAVVVLHYPAGFFVERVLGIGFSPLQLLLSAAFMVPIWVSLLFCIRYFLSGAHGRSR